MELFLNVDTYTKHEATDRKKLRDGLDCNRKNLPVAAKITARYLAPQTMRPATMVAWGAPVNSQPSNGVLRLLD